MGTIKQQDFIDSIADALQYISFYHPLDFVQALEKAYHKEESQAAKDAIAQILINSRMSAHGKRPNFAKIPVLLPVSLKWVWPYSGTKLI